MPKGKCYSTCSKQVIQGRLSCRDMPKECCCIHGYIGKDSIDKRRLMDDLSAMSDHFKKNWQFLNPCLKKSYPPTKAGLINWGSDLWLYDKLLHNALACDLSSNYKEGHYRNPDDFFLHLIRYVECPICDRLNEEKLPIHTNPRALLKSFYRENKESTNVEGEKLDELIEKLVEEDSPSLCLYKDLVEARKEDPHVCIKYVKAKRRKQARADLKSFLLSACYNRPTMRTRYDLGVYGLSESSGSSGGSCSVPVPSDYILVPTIRKSRSVKKRVAESDKVLGLRASSSRDTLSLGPGSKTDKEDRERGRSLQIIAFTSWKSRLKRVNRKLRASVESDYPHADETLKLKLLADRRKNHSWRDMAYEQSRHSRNEDFGTESDVSSNPRSDTSV